jgi:hypothetical protein
MRLLDERNCQRIGDNQVLKSSISFSFLAGCSSCEASHEEVHYHFGSLFSWLAGIHKISNLSPSNHQQPRSTDLSVVM